MERITSYKMHLTASERKYLTRMLRIVGDSSPSPPPPPPGGKTNA